MSVSGLLTTVTVQGKEHAPQTDLDDWMSGVGDRAAWSPELHEFVVAARLVRSALSVRAVGDAPLAAPGRSGWRGRSRTVSRKPDG